MTIAEMTKTPTPAQSLRESIAPCIPLLADFMRKIRRLHADRKVSPHIHDPWWDIGRRAAHLLTLLHEYAAECGFELSEHDIELSEDDIEWLLKQKRF